MPDHKLTPTERRLAAHLLREASATWGIWTCDEMDLPDLVPDLAERRMLVRAVCVFHGEGDDYAREDVDYDLKYRLADYLADQLWPEDTTDA